MNQSKPREKKGRADGRRTAAASGLVNFPVAGGAIAAGLAHPKQRRGKRTVRIRGEGEGGKGSAAGLDNDAGGWLVGMIAATEGKRTNTGEGETRAWQRKGGGKQRECRDRERGWLVE